MKRLRVDAQVAAELNRIMVFDHLRARPVVSRIDLARETGLSKATISQIIDHFLREGLVQTVGPGESERGRRPTLLRVDPQARVAIGVEIGDTSCSGVLTDLYCQPIRTASTSMRPSSPDDALASAVALVEQLRSDIAPEKILGIGVGTPGLVDSKLGIIRFAPDLGWSEVAVGPYLADHFETPVVVVNRAKAAAVGEAWSGAGENVDNLVYLSISSGISAGIVIDKRLYRGVTLSEGEIGHTTVLPDGPLCACGNRGCLQTVAAGPAILAMVRERLRARLAERGDKIVGTAIDRISLDWVADAANNGDPAVLSALDEAAGYIGITAANLVNTLNPRMVILGGSVVRALPMLVPKIEAVLRRRAMTVVGSALTVVRSQLQERAVPIGAAAFLFSQLSIVGSHQLFDSTDFFTSPVIHPSAVPSLRS